MANVSQGNSLAKNKHHHLKTMNDNEQVSRQIMKQNSNPAKVNNSPG